MQALRPPLSEIDLDTLEGGETFLEIGVGGGANLKRLQKKFSLVIGTDLNRDGGDGLRSAGADLVLADRANCFRASSFDAIAFNPPYLPSEKIVDRAVDGGSDGMQIPLEFLSSALKAIKPGGRILMLVSDLGSIHRLEEYCALRNLQAVLLVERKLFFETLFVYEIVDGKD